MCFELCQSLIALFERFFSCLPEWCVGLMGSSAILAVPGMQCAFWNKCHGAYSFINMLFALGRLHAGCDCIEGLGLIIVLM